MPDAIITSTASTFGTITGTFASDQSTITGTVTGIITGTLDGSVGVPGVGVPDGGTTGMVLQKATNTSYDTVWATPSGGAWGTITGTLSNQTDLQTALNLKAPLASPALSGVPTAPTAATLTSTTQLATTAFVQQELLSGTANAKNLEVYVRNQTGATLAAGTIVYINGATGNRPTITLAQANNDANSAQTFGFVKTSIANNGFGFVIVRGELENIDTSALTEGAQLYLSPTTAGTWTTTKPSAPQHLVYVGICVRAHPTQGVILVAVQNGYEISELHDVKITGPTNGQVLKYDSTQSLWVNGTDVGGVAWGGITGTLSSQTDLQSALDAKLAVTTAASTYQTLSGMSDYLSKDGNLAGLASTSTSRTNLGLGSLAVINDAPSDGSQYARKNGAWDIVSAGTSYISSVSSPLSVTSGNLTIDLSAYLTSATAASTYFTIASAAGKANLSGATFTNDILVSSSPDTTTVGPGILGMTSTSNSYFLTLSTIAGYPQIFFRGPTGDSVQTVAYPGPTGFMLKADNLSGLANTGTARTNLGLGTMAVETASNYITTATAASTYQTLSGMSSYLTTATAASTYQTISGMSSYLTTASAASTYFTIASAANKADLASPALTGVPTAPTAAAATNTTQIATTAFVQQEVPAASTTAAGKVELATVDEALRPSSSTLGMTPETTREMLMYPGYINLFGGGNVATSGTGAASTFTFATQRWHAMRSPNATVAGYGMYIFDYSFSGIGMAAMTRGSSSHARKWNNKIWLSGRTVLGQFAETTSGLNGDANCTARVMLGGRSSAGTGGMQAADCGIGWRVAGGGSAAIVMTVSTGTTLTETTSSFTPVLGQVFDWKMYSDGTGNVTLWVNDSQVATSTGGPSTSTAETTNFYCEVVEQTASAATPLAMGNFGSKVFWSQA